MSNFWEYVETEFNRYKYKYIDKQHKAATRLMLLGLRGLFKAKKIKKIPKYTSWIKVIDQNDRDITVLYKDDLLNFRVPKIPKDARINFDIDKAFELNPNFNRIGLIVFNGIGDYFLTTAFIEDLKKKYPNIPFDAYVSKNRDNNGTPVLEKLLRVNPNFENVYTFNGKSDLEYYKNFHFEELYDKVGKNVLLLPLIYDFDPYVRSRHINMCNNYNLPRPVIAHKPVVYTDYDFSDAACKTLENIKSKMAEGTYKGIVWLALDSACFKYHYPYNSDLIKSLIELGYLVVCVDKNESNENACITIDTNEVDINNSIKLLKELNSLYKVQVICFASCFCAVSSAFNIPNLCVQFIYDGQIESVTHTNIYVVSNVEYKCLPITRQFIANKENYDCIKSAYYYNYKPDFIIDCFSYMLGDLT